MIDSWVYGEPGHGYTVAYYKKENCSYVHKHSDKGTIADNGRGIATSRANGEGSWKLVITDIVNKSTATFTWDQ
ncbi:hypothetical protein PIL02S_00497 [Paenibacillus illinoisensis]|uniref:Uncharacterized protein n=1 Tax=Paenibacillus illinoisensis TaxID=59845 RepID=A0A2W0CDR8_9BACL|nr:hypothetical protein PIL02S_00497 [Paenibacillus illinoisensis]